MVVDVSPLPGVDHQVRLVLAEVPAEGARQGRLEAGLLIQGHFPTREKCGNLQMNSKVMGKSKIMEISR